MRRAAALAAFMLLAGCGGIDWLGTASRTVRNICTNASNCTVYDENGAVKKGELDPWETKR